MAPRIFLFQRMKRTASDPLEDPRPLKCSNAIVVVANVCRSLPDVGIATSNDLLHRMQALIHKLQNWPHVALHVCKELIELSKIVDNSEHQVSNWEAMQMSATRFLGRAMEIVQNLVIPELIASSNNHEHYLLNQAMQALRELWLYCVDDEDEESNTADSVCGMDVVGLIQRCRNELTYQVLFRDCPNLPSILSSKQKADVIQSFLSTYQQLLMNALRNPGTAPALQAFIEFVQFLTLRLELPDLDLCFSGLLPTTLLGRVQDYNLLLVCPKEEEGDSRQRREPKRVIYKDVAMSKIDFDRLVRLIVSHDDDNDDDNVDPHVYAAATTCITCSSNLAVDSENSVFFETMEFTTSELPKIHQFIVKHATWFLSGCTQK